MWVISVSSAMPRNMVHTDDWCAVHKTGRPAGRGRRQTKAPGTGASCVAARATDRPTRPGQGHGHRFTLVFSSILSVVRADETKKKKTGVHFFGLFLTGSSIVHARFLWCMEMFVRSE